MKYVIIFFVTMFCSNSYASTGTVCSLEQYFLQTDSYKSSLLDNMEKKIDLDRKKLSLLPDIYIGMNQYSNNKRSFKSLKESSLSVGISQTIYEGGKYIKNQKIAKIEAEYNRLLIHDKRNNYLIDLYRDVIEYKYKLDLRELYISQLEKQNVQLEAAKASYLSGNIATIEYNAAKIRRDEIWNNLKYIDNEIEQSALDIYTNFNIPIDDIQKINNDTILSCKSESSDYILKQSRELLYKKEKANYELDRASLQPHVGFSVYVSPPDTGTWNDLSLRKSDFGASINLTIPVSNFFSMNAIDESHAIAISRINNSHDERKRMYFREKEKTKKKINELKNHIELSKKIVELKSNEVDYTLSLFKERKENIMSYYRQVDEYESAKINLKKEEREIEFNKVYLNILD